MVFSSLTYLLLFMPYLFLPRLISHHVVHIVINECIIDFLCHIFLFYLYTIVYNCRYL